MTRERSAAAPEAAQEDFEPPIRIQTSLLAAPERRILDALCRRAPAWATPDGLTAVGSIGMAVAAIGYVASWWRPEFLFLASLGLVINWFGDSLDGSLSRYRRIERPRYGYFVDHSVDAINNLVFAVGLGLSPYVSMTAALLLLGGYYLMTIHVVLSALVRMEFSASSIHIGPTELRLIAIAFNLVVYGLGPVDIAVAGFRISLWSALVAGEAIVFIVLFVAEGYATARRLAQESVANGRVG